MSDILNEFAKKEAPDANAVETVKSLCSQAREAQETIDSLDAALKAAKESFREIAEDKLPAALDILGMTKFELEDGTVVNLNRRFFASLPKESEKRTEALDEIKRLGGLSIIKSEVSARFDGTAHNEALSAFEGLKAEGFDDVTMVENVHPATLAKFAKESKEAGSDPDLKKMGVFQHNRAEFKLPRKSKKMQK